MLIVDTFLKIPVFIALVYVCGCVSLGSSFAPPQRTLQVIEFPQFGIAEIDDQLRTDFSVLSDATVDLGQSGKMPLREFLTTVKSQLGCPDQCEGYSLCEPVPAKTDEQSCQIQWSKIVEQREDQDIEPGSVWTMEYRLSKSMVDLKSIYGFWKDY